MDKHYFIQICDQKLKLVRTEYSLSQEKMALMLGLSKKTLIEIEKGRTSLGWMGSVALCYIFGESQVITSVFGGKPTDIILSLAFEGSEPTYPKITGGKVWWKTTMENEKYTIQQNVISNHYRLLNNENRRVASSFDMNDLTDIFHGLNNLK